MTRTRRLLLGAAVLGAMITGGVVGATVLASPGAGGVPALSSVFAAATPAATPKSNETATHETGETAARETAEKSGTFRPGGGGPGHSNETATHETGESATREAAENSAATK